jgi:lysophospholipase L1-like esterase
MFAKILPVALLLGITVSSVAGSSLPGVLARARANGSLRIAWMGTSITCGLGATSEAQRFSVQVNTFLERQTGAKITSQNFCFGGAHSLLQIALLKTSVVPWKPDLVIAELGTLDEFYQPISLPAIEAFMRIAYSARLPLIALYPYTTYADVARLGLHKLAALYGYDVIDMVSYASRHGVLLQQITEDGCHPNDRGQALIAAAFKNRINLDAGEDHWPDALPKLIHSPDLSGVNFQPISLDAGAERVTPRSFDGQGYALRISGELTITQAFRGSLIGLLFQFQGAPGKMSYRIDGGEWSDVQIAPEWFLNYVLRTDLADTGHTIELRITPHQGGPAVLEGLLANKNR